MSKVINLDKAVAAGLLFNKHGGVSGLNPSQFTDYFLKDEILIYANDENFYNYDEGVYRLVESIDIIRESMNLLNSLVSDCWKPSFESLILKTMRLKTHYNGDLNPQKNYINLKNGMFDIERKKLVKHSPEYFSTVQLPFAYDSKANCPRWMEFVPEIFEGDEERGKVLQECMGIALTPITKQQKACVMYGTGSNAKGIVFQILTCLVGKENISTLGLRELDNAFNRASLQGKLIMLSSESEFDRPWNTEWFKKITGGDRISAAYKFKNVFDFQPICKIFMSVNALPAVKDRSVGFFRRLLILHFSAHFSVKDGTADLDLIDKLKAELPGIFNWALEGLYRLQSNDYRFSPCKSADDMLAEYQVQQNPYLDFIESGVTECKSDRKTENRVIYESFKVWCKNNGHRQCAEVSSRKFWVEFDKAWRHTGKKPFKRNQSGGTRYCWGIDISPEFKVF